MPDMNSLLSAVELSKGIASMLSFLFLFVGVSVAAGFVFGRNKLVNIFINVYIALAFVSIVPATLLPRTEYSEAILFAVLLVFLTTIDQHLFDLHIPNASYDIFWRMIVMSFMVVGMVMSVLVSLLPASLIRSFPFPFVADYFGSPLANMFWLSVPLLVLVFMNKRLR